MKVTQLRKWFENVRTISELAIEGSTGKWFVCEDVVRGGGDPKTVAAWKVPKKTAIPYGTYQVVWTNSPSRGVDTLRLINVPGYQGILVHSGNTEEDTDGCLLPGMRYKVGYGVEDSKVAVAQIEAILVPKLKAGEEVLWTITT